MVLYEGQIQSYNYYKLIFLEKNYIINWYYLSVGAGVLEKLCVQSTGRAGGAGGSAEGGRGGEGGEEGEE